MRRALALAHRARWRTSPNPAVGAVLVKDGALIGEGYHRAAGTPHAEIEALRAAGARARGASLYVSLEPCNHTGRTPPCCDAILAAGVSRVVAAMRDPNPITRGRGLARLRQAGVEVRTGVLAQEARALNATFHKAMTTRLPFVIVKIAQSLDGKIATVRGESRWITSSASRALGHQWRARVDAILVGVNTVLRDDPLLTPRRVGHRHGRPVKVIVDSTLRTPLTARCLSSVSSAPTLIATTTRASGRRRTVLRARGVELLVFRPRQGRVPLAQLGRRLVQRDIHSLLIEGGGEVLASAFAERLVDRVLWCVAPVLIGGRTAPGAIGGAGVEQLARAVRLADVSVQRAGPDLCLEARVVYPSGRSRVRAARRKTR